VNGKRPFSGVVCLPCFSSRKAPVSRHFQSALKPSCFSGGVRVKRKTVGARAFAATPTAKNAQRDELFLLRPNLSPRRETCIADLKAL